MVDVAPSWLHVGARVVKNGAWPRVGLADRTEGTVDAVRVRDGTLIGFTVRWDGLSDRYPLGVEHPGWHATQGNVVSATLSVLQNGTTEIPFGQLPDVLYAHPRLPIYLASEVLGDHIELSRDALIARWRRWNECPDDRRIRLTIGSDIVLDVP